MNKWQIICPLTAIVVALGAVAVMHGRSNQRYFIQAATASIGADLIKGTNSPILVGRLSDDGILAHLEGRLADLHRSPMHVAAVLMGDEPAPVGDGAACSRLVITNEEKDGILMRLEPADATGRFRVLGYLKVPQKG